MSRYPDGFPTWQSLELELLFDSNTSICITLRPANTEKEKHDMTLNSVSPEVTPFLGCSRVCPGFPAFSLSLSPALSRFIPEWAASRVVKLGQTRGAPSAVVGPKQTGALLSGPQGETAQS